MEQKLSHADLVKVLCVVCIWGFNFAAIKFTVADVPPLAMTFVRFALTALILAYLFKPDLDLIKKMFPISLVMGIGHFGLLYLGISGVDGSTAAILIQLGTPFSVLLVFFLYKESLPLWALSGIGLSFGGAILLSGEPQGGAWWGIVAIAISAFCWALANIMIKKVQINNPLSIIFWVNFLSLPGLFILSSVFETGQMTALHATPLSAWLGLIYTVVASSLLAYYLWYGLLSCNSVNTIVPYSLAVPFIGVMSTVLVHEEPLTMFKIIGGILTVMGVALIYMSQNQKAKAAHQ